MLSTETPIRRGKALGIRSREDGYRVTVTFEIDMHDGIGPEGLQYCEVGIVVPLAVGQGKTVDELIAEAWRRFDLIKPQL